MAARPTARAPWLVGAAWTLWERQQHDPWLRLLRRAHRRLQRLGLQASEQLPPRGLAQQVMQHWGETPFAQSLSAWLLRLEAQRYARGSPLTLATLQNEFQQLNWPREPKR